MTPATISEYLHYLHGIVAHSDVMLDSLSVIAQVQAAWLALGSCIYIIYIIEVPHTWYDCHWKGAKCFLSCSE